MGEEVRSLADLLAYQPLMSDEEFLHEYGEWLLGATAILLQQQGHSDTSLLLTEEVRTLELIHTETDWGIEYYDGVLRVAPDIVPQFTDKVIERVQETISEATTQDGKREVVPVRARMIVPNVGANWREQIKSASGPKQKNQARRARVEPDHPFTDQMHFTNQWEYGVYLRLKERQEAMPDNETIGIIPLPAMRVLNHTYEPDIMITYKGRAGVIEIDGPHHKDRASADKSRERLLRNAGVKYVDRLDVRDTTREEVEKFITDFLKHLAA